MGAEQSSVLDGEPLPTLYTGLDATASVSLPASPSRSSHSDSSQKSLQQSGRSLSLSVGQNRVPSILDTQLSNPTTSSQPIPMYRSSSVSDAPSRGIVVVCPGPTPLQRSQRSTSLDSLRHRPKPEASGMRRKLNHIPSFSPFISGGNKTESTATKVVRPSVLPIDYTKLVQLVDVYQVHIRQSTESTCKSQQRILGLQNKVDYELKRLADELKARGEGVVTTSPSRSTKTHDSMEPTVNHAGQKQIDELVLQSTQISGLIDQSNETVRQLQESLNTLNQFLPSSNRLPPLSLSLFNSST